MQRKMVALTRGGGGGAAPAVVMLQKILMIKNIQTSIITIYEQQNSLFLFLFSCYELYMDSIDPRTTHVSL